MFLMGTSSLHPGFSIARVDYRRVTKNFSGNVNNLHLAGSNSHPSRTGWWFQPTPLKNDGVRQLGSWHSQLNGKSWNSCSKLTRSLSSTCLQMIFPLKPPFIMGKIIHSCSSHHQPAKVWSLINHWEFHQERFDFLEMKTESRIYPLVI